MNYIFAQNSIEVEIDNWGCFGGMTESFVLSKLKNSYQLKSQRTKKSHLISTQKIDSLKLYLTTRIGEEYKGLCTSCESIRMGNWYNMITYGHCHCSGPESDVINSLINYYELTSYP